MNKKSFRIVSTLLASQLAMAPALSMAATAAPSKTVVPQLTADQQLMIEQQIATTDLEIARLIIFNSMIQAQIGEITQISDKVAKKYDKYQTSILAPVTLVLGIGATYGLGASAAEKLQSILEPINVMIKVVMTSIRKGITVSSEVTEQVLKALKIDKVLDVSSEYMDQVIKTLKTVSAAYSGKGSLTLSASSGAGSSLSLSAFVFFNDTNEALKQDVVKKLLGYNKEVDARVDKLVKNLSFVYAIPAEKSTQIKDALKNAMIAEAEKHEFITSDNAKIDVIAILLENGLVSPSQASAAAALDALIESKSSTTISVDPTKLITNIKVTLALMALLEEAQNSGKIADTAISQEADRILGAAQRNLKRIDVSWKIQ